MCPCVPLLEVFLGTLKILFSHALYWYIRFDSGENLVGSTVRFRGKTGVGDGLKRRFDSFVSAAENRNCNASYERSLA